MLNTDRCVDAAYSSENQMGAPDHALSIMVMAARRANRRSGCGFEGDLVAEGLELLKVAALLAVGAGPVVVELGSEVVEPSLGIRQQVPHDDQDRAADHDDGLLSPTASGDASIAFAEEGVGLGGGHGGLGP